MVLENRYQRHWNLQHVGEKGQKRLENQRVLVIGAGGLGSPALSYLAAAGVGTLGICDGDVVESSNLNRQILHGVDTLGLLKVESAITQLNRLNPELNYWSSPERITAENIAQRLKGWDLVLDCTDKLETRYLISDYCRIEGIPLIEAGIEGWEGFVYPILNGDGPCYRCLFPEANGSALVSPPVMGAVAGIMGALMAQEAIKFLLGMNPPSGRLYRIDGANHLFHSRQWPRRGGCVCEIR